MSGSAPQQLSRIVQMVAELSRRERDGQELVPIGEIAAQLGVSPRQVERDIRTLTMVGDDPDHDWLSSLSVIQEGDQIALSSRGHYQRPVRLTPDELLAIQAGLAADEGGAALSAALGTMLGDEGGRAVSALESAASDEARTVDVARRAANESRCLEIVYAGAKLGDPTSRVIEVHQLVAARGKFYLVAWCRKVEAQRHFRADRVLAAKLLDERFTVRPGMPVLAGVDGIFDAAPEVREQVRVSFSPSIARWVTEEHPDAEADGLGGVVVTYQVSEPAWLVRTVLGYGADAEVVEPAAYRLLMRRSMA